MCGNPDSGKPRNRGEMNGLSDSLTIGLVISLIFGALFFYLYTRLTQAEKRVSLTENILLDLKMATENTLLAMGSVSSGPVPYAHNHDENEDDNEDTMRVEPISAPVPLDTEDVDQLPTQNEEDFYKSVLEQTDVPENTPVSSPSVEINYESMTTKELKAMAKQRGVAVSSTAHKKEVIDSLKRALKTQTVTGSLTGGMDNSGFPVEMGTQESENTLE